VSQLLPERRSASAPERWNPFEELEQVTERMRRMLDHTFGRLGATSFMQGAAGWSPPVDIEEHDDAYVLEAELPGVKRDDIDIELIGNELAITGELKEKERAGTVRRRTRDYHVTLPEQVDADKIEASLAEGVLTVRVPKSERAQRKKIAVRGA
jgi:HSP20 family protein